MNNVAKMKIDGIMWELENACPYSTHKTTKEVVDILLKGKETISESFGEFPYSVSEFPYSFTMDEMEYWRVACNERQEVHYWRPIFSARRFWGRYIVFAKKVIRRILMFLIFPMVQEANQFHQATVATINTISNAEITTQAFMRETLKRIEFLESEVERLNNNC